MIQESRLVSMLLFPDFHSGSRRRTTSQTICHWQTQVEVTGALWCFGTTPPHSIQEPHTSNSHSCQQWQKAPKYCSVTAATDVAQYQTISGKATNVCRSTVWRSASFPRSPTHLLVFKYGEVLFPLQGTSLTDKSSWSQSMLFHFVSVCPFT